MSTDFTWKVNPNSVWLSDVKKFKINLECQKKLQVLKKSS